MVDENSTIGAGHAHVLANEFLIGVFLTGLCHFRGVQNEGRIAFLNKTEESAARLWDIGGRLGFLIGIGSLLLFDRVQNVCELGAALFRLELCWHDRLRFGCSDFFIRFGICEFFKGRKRSGWRSP